MTVATDWYPPGNGLSYQELDPTNATFTGTLSTTAINLSVSGGTANTPAGFVWINPPPGTSFHIGYYSDVRAAGVKIPVAGFTTNLGCGGTHPGGIDIRDLAVSGSTITRLDLLYEQTCGATERSYGEIRIGEPEPAGLIVSSSAISWPVRPGIASGRHGATIPVYVRNPSTSPVAIGPASLHGLAAPEFTLSNDSCSGTVLQPGNSCVLDVGFTASTRGPRTATLQLPLGTQTYYVQLDSLVRPGDTSLTAQSQPGDPLGQGGSYSFTTASNDITATVATFSRIDIAVNDSQSWGSGMNAPPGDILGEGTYANADAYNGQIVIRNGIGCQPVADSFTVKQALYSAVDNALEHFDATFIQYCDGSTAALTGEVKYDAEPVTSAVPVSGLKATATSSGVAVSWVNPTSSSYRYTLVRIEPSGSPVGMAPYAGRNAYGGGGTKTVAHGLLTGHIYTIAAYAVDQYGNISPPVTTKITP